MGGRRAGTLGRVVGVALRTSKRACRATGGIDITAGSAPDGKKKQKGPGVNDRLHKPQIRVPRRARTPRCSRLALAARSSLDAGDSANGNALASGGPWRVAVGSLAALWRVAVTSTVLLRQIPALARAQLARKFDTVILTNSITTVRRLRYVYGSWCMQPCIADCCLPPRILLCAHACIVALASIRPYASLCTHPRTSLSHHHSSWPPQLATGRGLPGKGGAASAFRHPRPICGRESACVDQKMFQKRNLLLSPQSPPTREALSRVQDCKSIPYPRGVLVRVGGLLDGK